MTRAQLETAIWRLLTAGLGHGERGVDPLTVAAILDAADAYRATPRRRPDPVHFRSHGLPACKRGRNQSTKLTAEQAAVTCRPCLDAMTSPLPEGTRR